ncbi:MAG: hypothetical protein DMF73_05945 [Acidobacteria bacterium]|nr:MAG: hypothetical protein DMF73_05945 [Acidobacteriota bacterium]
MAESDLDCEELLSPSVCVCPQPESFKIFSTSFSDHSVHGFVFWAEVETAKSISSEQVNRTVFIVGTLGNVIASFGKNLAG